MKPDIRDVDDLFETPVTAPIEPGVCVLESLKQYRVVVRFYAPGTGRKGPKPGPILVSKVPRLTNLAINDKTLDDKTQGLVKLVLTGTGNDIAKWLRQLMAIVTELKLWFRVWHWRLSEMAEVDLKALPAAG